MHHKNMRESGESPNKDNERSPWKKTRNLAASPNKQPTALQDSKLCMWVFFVILLLILTEWSAMET